MIDLFFPPKPVHREPSFIHRIYDEPDKKQTTTKEYRKLWMREWRRKNKEKVNE